MIMVDTPKERTRRASKAEARVSEMTRREADRQARRVPWKLLLEAGHQYVEWNAFGLWVRAIAETEGQVPDWLAEILKKCCPGLLESGPRSDVAAPLGEPLVCRRISEWIEGNVVGQAKHEGWLRAVTYFGARDPSFLRDCAHWQHCVTQWKQQRPSRYPSFEEWRKASEQCDDEVLDLFEMREDKRQIIKAARAIGPERFAQAVAQYIEWEAFTYWLRSLLEADTKFPDIVTKEVQGRCPGFLEHDEELRSTLSPENYARRWKALVEWGENRFFVEARKEGWFDALVSFARAHPRSARTVDYWVFYWDEHWLARSLETYPSFQEWRQAADDYVVQSGNE
jgi:hypothetical protein